MRTVPWPQRYDLSIYLCYLCILLYLYLCQSRYGTTTKTRVAWGAEAVQVDPNSFDLLINTYGRPVRFLRENNTQCTNGTVRNSTVVKENAISFNFFRSFNEYDVFQMPRCLFSGLLAEQLLNQVDLSETLEAYYRRLDVYALVSTRDLPSYRAFDLKLEATDALADRAVTVPAPGEMPMPAVQMQPPSPKDLVFTLPYVDHPEQVHRPAFQQTCHLFKDHDLLFSALIPCLEQEFLPLGTNNRRSVLTLTLTEDFFALRATIDDAPALLLFGDLSRVAFKAPYQRDNFVLRQTQKHELLVLIKKSHLHRHPYLKEPDFLEAALKINYLDMSAIMAAFHGYAVKALKNGRCQSPLDRSAVELAFGYGLTLLSAGSPQRAHESRVHISRLLDRQAALLQAQDFMTVCLRRQIDPPSGNTTLSYPRAVEMARKAFTAVGAVSTVPSLTRAAYILARHNDEKAIPKWAMQQLGQFAVTLHKSHLASFLSAFARQELYLLGAMIHSMSEHTNERRLIFIIETGLCSLAELAHFTRMLADDHHEYLSDLYTPCSSSGRRDHSLERLARMFPDAPIPETVPTALSILAMMQPRTLSAFRDLACLPLDESFSALTVSEHTSYVTGEKYLLKGTSYPVSTTVVGQSLIITRTESHEECELTRNMHTTRPIVAAFNISLEDCAFCQSALMEYDDTQGIVNLMYLHDGEDVLFALDAGNNVVVPSPRTHYLMLLKNGTVLEVTDVVIDATDSRALMMAIYALSAIVAIYLIYRLLKLC
ncbi:envelope glycoprotein H [Panine betaherpesvirus 2]|uniref:Envelope glycoprotein H n=1 Tax=Panine betaherpesvirus 2 TaxID=188763 RepID=Q8QS24_9BETA|nr:envelope glycoprotein H [Panine betaherpesvirus 2]AAM00714.1 envelope glycoprotein H [Panine betaherpesvirus 2]QXV67823.1 envelope glycoprotein H [Panine betaherpesvirus 2]